MKFGYARVYTEEQHLEMQLDDLNVYGIDELITEKISSGKEHPELNNLLNKLRKDDVLVVWKLDRLGRTVKQLISLIEYFNEKGINFVSLTENIDTTTPVGVFTFNIFAAAAQMERDIIGARTKVGLADARSRGRHIGRPRFDQKKVDAAIKLYETQGMSSKEVCETIGISRATFFKHLNEYRSKQESS